jgi:hypothetical protein
VEEVFSEVAPALLTLHTGDFVDQHGGADGPRSLWRRWAIAMYVAVRRYEGVTNPSEAGRIVDEGFVPIISGMPGFVAYYWVDAGDGVMISTSVFEHKDAEEQSTFMAGEFVAEHLEPLMPNPPQITAGEVVAYKAG